MNTIKAQMYRHRDKNRLKTVKIYQRTEETAHNGASGFSYCWVIAGIGGRKQLSARQ